MRLSREAKAEHREDIMSSASRMMRERGIERTSVADLMQSVGLTHGGFYRHFSSKDELVAISSQKAFEEVVERFERRTAESGPQAALETYVLEYLSDPHRDDPATGCVVSACGPEAARQGSGIRDAFTQGMNKLLGLTIDGLSCPQELRVERAIELLSLMLGAIVIARATSDTELSSKMLSSVRERAIEIVRSKH